MGELLLSALINVSPAYKECTTCYHIYEHRDDYFNATVYVGIVKTGKYSEYDLELRNCSCGSTLATYIDKDSQSIEIPKIVDKKPRSRMKTLRSTPNIDISQLKKKS